MNQNEGQRFSLWERVTIVIVSAYLICAGVWLALTGALKLPSLSKVLRARWRRPFEGTLGGFAPEEGCCYVARVPHYLLSDLDSVSQVQVYEDGLPLGPAHASHADIRALGGGRFSHWGSDIYFSTSDNTDPRTNGRKYSVREGAGS